MVIYIIGSECKCRCRLGNKVAVICLKIAQFYRLLINFPIFATQSRDKDQIVQFMKHQLCI
ncbi:hypothetical protein DXB65_02115 [Bacteroides oleiciplenus]|uniref:Uncharacterized protein n=1 Tax=Bacteroides oleiciplenus TaxID=626931 RepID=A0A3E5BSU1_9BACE|nr:hypothetical protein DXB65_02115 [Bacteroides oleiciplenus]